MSTHSTAPEVVKTPTGITGLDEILNGGLPLGRTTLLAGTAGSGKTVLALEYLYQGAVKYDQPGVLVTFEEPPLDMMQNVRSFGWDFEEMIEQKSLAIVDAVPGSEDQVIEAGSFDLSGLLARIEHAIQSIGAKRVILDAIGALFPQFSDAKVIRRELHRIHMGLKLLGVTTLITMERVDEEGSIGRFGIEEFVADNVILMRNRLESEKRRRTVEVLKLRGGTHHKGEYPFTIDATDGVTIIPLSSIQLKQPSSVLRVSSGVAEIDRMSGGGMYRDSIILVSGATGTGKTLMVTEYVKAAIESGQRALLIGSEESREQLTRNASAWGVDFEKAEQDGLLKMICRYPELMGLEDHLIHMKRDINEFKPDRVAVDSLSAFERVSTPKAFREFVISLTSHVKHLELTSLFTNTAPMLVGGESITETHISTITDAIILLRYVELMGEMRRGLAILKMRGTWHEKEIREYVIDGTGMHVLEPFRGVNGILSGTPSYSFGNERDRLDLMFEANKKTAEDGVS